jgi:protein TonB
MKSKNPKADLEKSKSLFFQIGLIAALSLSLLAFEWKSNGNLNNLKPNGDDPVIEVIELPTPIIDKEPPKPIIIPKIPEVINIVPDEYEPKDEPIIWEPTDEDLPSILPYRDPTEDVEDPDEVVPFVNIEDKPTFMGKPYNEFSRYIGRNLKYPKLPAQNGIQGMVVIEFVVDTDGSVTKVRVLKGVDPLLDQEAVRVVSSSPKWEPGRQRNKPARVSFTFPIYFRLS